jgi:hypothetical protein
LAERFPDDGNDALREIDFAQAASIASAAHRAIHGGPQTPVVKLDAAANRMCLRGGRFVAMDWYLIGLLSAAVTVVGVVSYLILAD